MKKAISFLGILFLSLSLGGCRVSELPPLGVEEVYGTTPSQEGVEEFLKLRTSGIGTADNNCWNITPDFMKTYSEYRIFKYSHQTDTYLLYQNTIYPIAFGPLWLTSLALADLNGDGLYEIYYTSAGGTGGYSSVVGYFDPADEENHYLGLRPDEETMIVCREGALSVWRAAYAPQTESYTTGVRPPLTAKEKLTALVFRGGEIQLDSPKRMEREN